MLRRRQQSNASCVVSLVLSQLLASIVPLIHAGTATDDLKWIPRTPCPISGVHHPITFANETHAFLLTGSTTQSTVSSDFYMYEESTDSWTDLTTTTSAFPGEARSFGYGVVLAESGNTKAYLGFGASGSGQRLNDLWEFDMSTHEWKELATLPGLGRRHPAMNAVKKKKSTAGGASNSWEIHVGLGDTYTKADGFFNLNDWWSYDISTNVWMRRPDLPSTTRHHPFYFSIDDVSYAGFGHSDTRIERDWFALNMADGSDWVQEGSMVSYEVVGVVDDDDGKPIWSDQPVTTEARVAGTQFSIELPLDDDDSDDSSTTEQLSGSLGFVLSGDGDDHGTMKSGEFHAFYPAGNDLLEYGPDGTTKSSWWRQLPPHPGYSRWAPGSFVMRGTARAYFTSGYDRTDRALYNDLWMMDLSPLFRKKTSAEQEVLADVDSMTDVEDMVDVSKADVIGDRDTLVDTAFAAAYDSSSATPLGIHAVIICIVCIASMYLQGHL